MLPDPLFAIKTEKETAQEGVFAIEPLKQGYGHTLGNALRRVLLTSLPGAAITRVKINGVKHKFSTLKGMREDVIELLLNIKRLRVAYTGKESVKIALDKMGPGEVTGKDIKTPAGVKIMNEDLVLAHLADKKSQLKMEMMVETGFGYLAVDDREKEKVGQILVDALFSPVEKVSYRVEATRVGRRTDMDRLVLEITTDGTVKASDALRQSAEVLVGYFTQVVKPKRAPKPQEAKVTLGVNDDLGLTIEEIGLPTRIINALRQAGYGTAGDLAAAGSKELGKVKNLGEKSIEMVKKALKKKEIEFK